MTTTTKQPITRQMLPTRTSKAFKPLREVFAELESGKPLDKKREERIALALTSLGTYAVHQEEKEKSGEEMYLPRIQQSVEISKELHAQIVKLAKKPNLQAMAHLLDASSAIVEKLKVVASRLEKREPTPKAAHQAPMPKETKAEPMIQVKRTADGGIQIGNLVIHDMNLAMSILERHVG